MRYEERIRKLIPALAAFKTNSGIALRILAFLIRESLLADSAWTPRITQDEIASTLSTIGASVSKASVNLQIRKLRKLGYLACDKGLSRHDALRYRLTLPGEDARTSKKPPGRIKKVRRKINMIPRPPAEPKTPNGRRFPSGLRRKPRPV